MSFSPGGQAPQGLKPASLLAAGGTAKSRALPKSLFLKQALENIEIDGPVLLVASLSFLADRTREMGYPQVSTYMSGPLSISTSRREPAAGVCLAADGDDVPSV